MPPSRKSRPVVVGKMILHVRIIFFISRRRRRRISVTPKTRRARLYSRCWCGFFIWNPNPTRTCFSPDDRLLTKRRWEIDEKKYHHDVLFSRLGGCRPIRHGYFFYFFVFKTFGPYEFVPYRIFHAFSTRTCHNIFVRRGDGVCRSSENFCKRVKLIFV